MRKDIYVTHDNATAHTINQFLLPLRDAFGEPVIHNLPPDSPHLRHQLSTVVCVCVCVCGGGDKI
jgi:hypothetical protein